MGCWHHTTHVLLVSLILKALHLLAAGHRSQSRPTLASAYQPTRGRAVVRKMAQKKSYHCQGLGSSTNWLTHRLKNMNGLRRKAKALSSFSLFGYICHLRSSQFKKNVPLELERLFPTRLLSLPGLLWAQGTCQQLC